MLTKRALLFIMVLFLLFSFSNAMADKTDPRVGTTGFGFLKISVGARPSALGSAFVAIPGDVNSIIWNPASLGWIRGSQGTATYTKYLLDTQAGFLGLAKSIDNTNIWGLSVSYLSYGSFRKTDRTGSELGSFEAGDLSANFAFAKRLSERLSLGTGIKVIYSRIDNLSSDAYTLDLGVLYKTPLEGLNVGLVAQNIGFVRKGYSDAFQDALPVNFKLGFSHQLAHLPLILLGDVNIPNDNKAYFSVGGEFAIAGTMFIRTGYNSMLNDFSDNKAGLSAGTGLLWRGYHLDYSYSFFAELGEVQRISVTGAF